MKAIKGLTLGSYTRLLFLGSIYMIITKILRFRINWKYIKLSCNRYKTHVIISRNSHFEKKNDNPTIHRIELYVRLTSLSCAVGINSLSILTRNCGWWFCRMGKIIEYKLRDPQAVHRVPLHQKRQCGSLDVWLTRPLHDPGKFSGHVHGTLRDDCQLSVIRQRRRCATVPSFGPDLAPAGFSSDVH